MMLRLPIDSALVRLSHNFKNLARITAVLHCRQE